jgi:hypothetical protein
MLTSQIQDLVNHELDYGPIGRQFWALKHATDRLVQQSAENEECHRGLKWLMEDEDEQLSTAKETKVENPVKKYAANKTPNYTAGVHGPGLPPQQVNQGAVVKRLTPDQIINKGREAAGIPPIELERQLKAEAYRAVQTKTWQQFCQSANKRLAKYENVPSGLHFDGFGAVQTGQIRS